jgi:hypothetical protein
MKWSVAIFSSREVLDTLSSSINAVVTATSTTETTIDVIVNGNHVLAEGAASYIQALRPPCKASRLVRVWYGLVPDKGHAWNQYLHEIWQLSDIAFFVDGYARVMPDAFTLIGDTIVTEPKALAVSGVPTIGRSAKAVRELMLREGGIHGTLHALRGDVLAQLRALGFRLPLGTYRVDGILGAVICFGLDPAKNDWDVSRILVHPKATWAFRPLTWRSVADLRTHLNRMKRQAQGELENLAVHEHLAVQKKSPQSLPRMSSELVNNWVSSFPHSALQSFVRNPLCILAARSLRHSHDWSKTKSPPELIAQISI